MRRLVGTAATFLILSLLPPTAVASGPANSLYGPLPPDVRLTGDLEADKLYIAAYRAEHALSRPRDVRTAAHLYCRAARRGHPGAAYRLGWLFLYGAGVPANDSQAAAWLEHAAENGSSAARGLRSLIQNVTPADQAPCASIAAPRTRREAAAELRAPHEIRELVEPMARRHDLDPELVLSVIAVESSFNSRAVSPKNAQGLMQLIPETAARFGVRNPFDAQENVAGGIQYLAWLVDRFDGELDKVLAAYNAGEGAVLRYGGVPPYPETQNYVRKVRRLYGTDTPATLSNGLERP